MMLFFFPTMTSSNPIIIKKIKEYNIMEFLQAKLFSFWFYPAIVY